MRSVNSVPIRDWSDTESNTMGDIFVTRRIFSEAIEKLEAAGHDVEINDTSRILPSDELRDHARDKDGLICLLNDEIDADLLDACPDLQVVSNVAVGYDNVDVDAATERGIAVTNTPGVLTETTADLTFALLMSAARRLPEADAYSREDNYDGWELMQPHMGVDVYEKTLGIWGMGRIGRAVARRAHHGFDMDIIYTSRNRKPEAEEELDAEFVSFDDLLEQSEFLSIHTPLTDETEGTFTADTFERMRDDAILINAARGPIVDEDDLAVALEAGEVRGAAIDTFEEEPDVNPHLAAIEEFVTLAPHIGSASRETRLKMARMAADNMISGLAGAEPPNIVNEDVLD